MMKLTSKSCYMELRLPVTALLLLASWCFPAFVLCAQAPAQQSPQPPLIKASANLVLVDVVVRNGDTPVLGLHRGDFRLQEDGHEQSIAAFDEHGSVAVTKVPPAKRPVLPAHTYSNLPDYPDTSTPTIVLLDTLNTPMDQQPYVRQQIFDYLENMRPGTMLAIFTLGSQLRQISSFTTDPALLRKAIESTKAGAKRSDLLDAENPSDLNSTADVADESMAVANSASNNPTSTTAMQFEQFVATNLRNFAADTASVQTDMRVRMTLDALADLAHYLRAIPGRKNLIWFSGSFPIVLATDSSSADSLRSMRNYINQARSVSDLLAAARIAVYPVDARGLMSTPSLQASYGSAGGKMPTGSSLANENAAFLQTQGAEHGSMQLVAEETGGRAYTDTNGLAKAIGAIVNDGSHYYTLGYVPKEMDGRFHTLHVQVANQHYQLEYRRGYYADSEGKAHQENPVADTPQVDAVLHGAPETTEIQFLARVLPATDPLLSGTPMPTGAAGELTSQIKGTPHRYVVDLNIDPGTLAFVQKPDSSHQAMLEFALFAFDDDGKRINFSDQSVLLNLPKAGYEKALKSGVPVRLALDLPTGPQYLRIAIRDLSTHKTGSIEIHVDIPKA